MLTIQFVKNEKARTFQLQSNITITKTNVDTFEITTKS